MSGYTLRDHIQSMTLEQLTALWDEHEAYERTGFIDADATLLELADWLMPGASPLLAMQMIAHEVWRAVAVRGQVVAT